MKEIDWLRGRKYTESLEAVQALAQRARTQLLTRFEYETITGDFVGRDLFRFSWPVIDQTYVDALTKYLAGRKVLEIAAGRGYLAKWMREAGNQWIATDINPTDSNWADCDPFTEIETLSGEAALDKYLNQVDMVVASWIPYCDPLDQVILAYCHTVKKPVLFIGEGSGGCTGSSPDEEGFDVEHPFDTEDVLQWYGIHDYTSVWIPNGKPYQLPLRAACWIPKEAAE